MITAFAGVKRINMILLSSREMGLSPSPRTTDFQLVQKRRNLQTLPASLERSHYSDDQQRSRPPPTCGQCEMRLRPCSVIIVFKRPALGGPWPSSSWRDNPRNHGD